MVLREDWLQERFVFLPVAQSNTGCESSEWRAMEMNSSFRLLPSFSGLPGGGHGYWLTKKEMEMGVQGRHQFHEVAFASPTTHLMTVKRNLFAGIS